MIMAWKLAIIHYEYNGERGFKNTATATVRKGEMQLGLWSQSWSQRFLGEVGVRLLKASLQLIAIAFRMSVFPVSLSVLSIFFMLSVKSLCIIVLLPFSAILTNLILFSFHVPSTTVRAYYCFLLLLNLFVICLYFSLSSPIWGYYVPGSTHRQWRYSIMVSIILLCFSFISMLTNDVVAFVISKNTGSGSRIYLFDSRCPTGLFFYTTLLNWEVLLKWYNFFPNFYWNIDFLLSTMISIDFNSQILFSLC